MKKISLIAAGSFALSGCSSVPMPDVHVPYFLPAAENDLTLTVVMGCKKDNNTVTGLVTSTNVIPSAKYVPDFDQPYQAKLNIHFGAAVNTLSDADITMMLQPDGRLIGINSQVMGEGGATLAAAAKLIAAVTPIAGRLGILNAPRPRDRAADLQLVCKDIDKFGSSPAAGKAVVDGKVAADSAPNDAAKDKGSSDQQPGKLLTLTYHLNVQYGIKDPKDPSDRRPENPKGTWDPVWMKRSDATPDLDETAAADPHSFVAEHATVTMIKAIQDADEHAGRISWVSEQNGFKFTLGAKVVPAKWHDPQDANQTGPLLPVPAGDDVLQSPDISSFKGNHFVPFWLNRVGIVRLEVDGTKMITGVRRDGSLNYANGPLSLWSANGYTPSRAIYAMPIQRGRAFGSGSSELTVTDSGLLTKVHYAKKAGAADMLSGASAIIGSVPNQTSLDKQQADAIYQQQRLVICETTPALCKSS